jgi:cation diffusion facilitator family transporter
MPHDAAPRELTTADRDRRVQRVLVITLVLNVGVAAAKLVYGVATDALAIRADGVHSFTDALNNVVALLAIWFASRPPDEDHPYGHRKFEFLAAGAIGVSLLIVAWDVVGDALARLQGAATLPHLDNLAYVVLGGTLLINLGVASYEARMAKRLGSPLLASDAHHTRSDVFVTVGVIVAVVFTQQGYAQADLVAALVVAGFIGWAGVRVLRENVAYLTDRVRLDPERVIAVAMGVTGVRDAHDVRSRGAPGHVFVDLHIHLSSALTIQQAHTITHDVMDAIKAKIDGVEDVTIHTEPDDHD